MYGRGEVLETIVQSPVYDNPQSGNVPYLETIAILNREENELSIFCVNRNPEEKLEITARLGGFGKCRLTEHIVLSHEDPEAVNSKDTIDRVIAWKSKETRIDKENLHSILEPLSWNVIRIRLECNHSE